MCVLTDREEAVASIAHAAKRQRLAVDRAARQQPYSCTGGVLCAGRCADHGTSEHMLELRHVRCTVTTVRMRYLGATTPKPRSRSKSSSSIIQRSVVMQSTVSEKPLQPVQLPDAQG